MTRPTSAVTTSPSVSSGNQFKNAPCRRPVPRRHHRRLRRRPRPRRRSDTGNAATDWTQDRSILTTAANVTSTATAASASWAERLLAFNLTACNHSGSARRPIESAGRPWNHEHWTSRVFGHRWHLTGAEKHAHESAVAATADYEHGCPVCFSSREDLGPAGPCRTSSRSPVGGSEPKAWSTASLRQFVASVSGSHGRIRNPSVLMGKCQAITASIEALVADEIRTAHLNASP